MRRIKQVESSLLGVLALSSMTEKVFGSVTNSDEAIKHLEDEFSKEETGKHRVKEGETK